MIQLVTLGFASAEVSHKVREVGGNNLGPRIKQYAANADPPMKEGLAWCALFVQFSSDGGAKTLGVKNPLDDVKQEALVQSYYDHLQGSQVDPANVQPGDLVLFKFPRAGKPSETWNHIGFVAQPPKVGVSTFWTIEGNTGDVDQRDGDGVYFKPRTLTKQPTCFIAWGRDATE